MTSQRRSAAWATATCLNALRASPASSSAPSAPRSTSWAMPSPSNTPTTSVSALVSAGAPVVAVTRMAADATSYTPGVPASDDGELLMAKTVILGTARTPIGTFWMPRTRMNTVGTLRSIRTSTYSLFP